MVTTVVIIEIRISIRFCEYCEIFVITRYESHYHSSCYNIALQCLSNIIVNFPGKN